MTTATKKQSGWRFCLGGGWRAIIASVCLPVLFIKTTRTFLPSLQSFHQTRAARMRGRTSRGQTKRSALLQSLITRLRRTAERGMPFQDIGVCEKIFVACCCNHIFLLEGMEPNNVRIGRGAPLRNDCMWLDGHTTPPDKRESDQIDAL